MYSASFENIFFFSEGINLKINALNLKACIKVVGTLLLKAAFTFVVPIFVLDSFVLSLVRTHYFLTLAFFSVLLLFFFKLYVFARSVMIWRINK